MRLGECLGEVLRAARKERGLSQEKLALDAGVERNYVSLIELGRNSPSIGMLFKLCKALDLPPSALLAQVEQQMRGGQKVRQRKR
jgi:transcriptional regulator with XRE-family HTH domain